MGAIFASTYGGHFFRPTEISNGPRSLIANIFWVKIYWLNIDVWNFTIQFQFMTLHMHFSNCCRKWYSYKSMNILNSLKLASIRCIWLTLNTKATRGGAVKWSYTKIIFIFPRVLTYYSIEFPSIDGLLIYCRIDIPIINDYSMEIHAISMEKLHYVNSKGCYTFTG